MITDEEYLEALDACDNDLSFLEEDDIRQYPGGWSNKVDNDIVVKSDYVELKPTHFAYRADELWQSCCDVLESREGWVPVTKSDSKFVDTYRIFNKYVDFGHYTLTLDRGLCERHKDEKEEFIRITCEGRFVFEDGASRHPSDYFEFSNRVRNAGSPGWLETQPCRLTQCKSLLAAFYKDVHDYYMENFSPERVSDLQTKCYDLPIQKDVQDNKDCGLEF